MERLYHTHYINEVSIQYGFFHVFEDYHDKHFSTVTTLIKFLSNIASFIYLEVIVTNKNFTKVTTFIDFFLSAVGVMSLKMSVMSKGFTILITFIGLLSCP